MPSKRLALKARRHPGEAFRVGYAPHPWAWVPWTYGPFTGRWDDPEPRGYRVIYAGKTAYACFVEVLANFRTDPDLAAEMAAIRADPRDGLYPSAPTGMVPRSWFHPRRLAHATLSGAYIDVQHHDSIAALRPQFHELALVLGFPDFDGAAIRSAEPRILTQEMSRFLWERSNCDGVVFESRFGNNLKLYAIFERPSTSRGGRSSLLGRPSDAHVDSNSRDFTRALSLHNLAIDEMR